MRRIHFVPALLAAVVTIAAAVPAAAVQSNLTIFLDFDNDASTGCNDPASGFQGYDQRVVTTVDTTTSPNAAMATQIEGFDCSNAQVFFDGTDHPVGIGNGDLGLNVVETFWPIVDFPPPIHPCQGAGQGRCLRLGVFAENANGGTDTLFTTDGSPTGPAIAFFFGGVADIPTLSQWGLLLLVLLLAGAAALQLRRRPLRALLLVLLVLGGGGVAYAVLGDLDGNTLEEWPPGSRIAHDPTATDDGDDIASLYARVHPPSARVFFRIDASLVFNTAPVVTTTAGATTFIEDGGAVVVDAGVTVTDSDSPNLASATVTITNPQDGAAETLNATACAGLTVGGGGTSALTITGSQPPAAYQTCLQSVTFDDSSQNPTAAPARVVRFVANDGIVASAPADKTVTVAPVNDAPVVTTTAGNTAFTEDSGAVVVDAGVTVTDVDNANLASATVTIANPQDGAAEVLNATSCAGLTVGGGGTATLNISGSQPLATYQSCLQSVTYDNTSQNPTPAPDRSISFVANDGTAASAPAAKTVTIAPSPDAPVVTTTAGSTAFTEDLGAVVVDAGVTVTDPDDADLASATVTITNVLDGAAEQLNATACAGLTVGGGGSSTLNISGIQPLATYQTCLQSVTYDNTDQDPDATARVISFVANDGTNSSAPANKTVTVTPVNDAPVVTTTAGTTAFTEDGGPVVVDSGVTVSDVDNANLSSATVTITNPQDGAAEVLAATACGGLTVTPGLNTLGISGSLPLASYQTCLQSVTYDNTDEDPDATTRILSFVVNDGALSSAPANKNVSVAGVNDAPVVTTTAGTTAFTEDGPAVVVDAGVTVTDADSPNLASATVTITNVQDGALESLTATACGALTVGGSGTATLSISGSQPPATYQTCLQSVTYDNTDQDPNTTTRVISFVANDGTTSSTPATKNVSVAPANDAPVVTTTAGTTAFTEDGPAVVVDSGVAVSDVDSTNLALATVTITNVQDVGFEGLAATACGALTVGGSGTPTLSISGSQPLATYQTCLQSVTYNNTDQDPNTTTRVISFVVNDGALSSTPATKNVSVTPTPDAPVVTTTAGSTSFTEGNGAVVVDSAVTVTDADSPNLASATVSITNVQDVGFEGLAATACGAMAVGGSGTPTLTITGSQPVATYQTCLQSVTYNNTDVDPGTTPRVISFVANDGALSSTPANKTVTVTAVNSTPSVTTTAGTTAFTEDGSAVVVDSGVTVTDDNANLASATVTITNVQDVGFEGLAATACGAMTVGGSGTPTLTITGSQPVATYQSCLQSVTYNNTSNNPNTTTRVISFVVSDGALSSPPATKSVSVTPVPDAPIVVTTAGDTAFTEDGGAVVVDSGVTVVDPDSPTLASALVTITNPQDGALESLAGPGCAGLTVVPGVNNLTITGVQPPATYQTCLQSVTFNDSAQNPGTTTRVISFVVNDGALSSTPATKNVTVAPVNDAPVVTTTAGTTAFVEDAGAVVIDSGVTVSDVDNANLSSATVTITNVQNAGSEALAATACGAMTVGGSGTPTLTITGSQPLATYQTCLQSVTYNNSSNDPNATTRVISFVANDGALSSAPANKNVSVQAVNDAPVVTTTAGTTAFTEDGPAVVIDSGVTVSDVDNANLASATVTITNVQDVTFEGLAATACGAMTVGGSGTPTLTITGSQPLATYQTCLQSVTYNNTDQDPTGAPNRSISFVVNDGTSSSPAALKAVSVTPVNDAPVVTTSAGITSFTEDGPAVLVDNALTVTDVDNANLASATVTITNVLDAGFESLTATSCAGLTVGGTATAMTITGSQPTLAYQNCLRSVTYNNTDQDPNATNRTIRFVVNDGALNSNNGDKLVSVTPVNDAPSCSSTINYVTPGNTQLHVNATIPGVAFWSDSTAILAKCSPTDPDGPSAATVVVASGASANSGSFSIVNNSGDFTFVPAAGFAAADSFGFQLTDGVTPSAQIVNVAVGPRVWYIHDVTGTNNPVGGDGRSNNAFDTVNAYNAVAAAATFNGDIIFIFEGNTVTTPHTATAPITLKDGQKLWGQGIALNVPGFGTPLAPAANQARVRTTTASTDVVSVPATAGNRLTVEIRGLDLQATGATSNAIDVTSSGGNQVGITITDDNIRGATAEGIDLNNGSTGAFTATVSTNTITSAGNGIDARTSAAGVMTVNAATDTITSTAGNGFDARTQAGAVALRVAVDSANVTALGTGIVVDGNLGGITTITGFANNTINGNTGGTGISVNVATFDVTSGGTFQQVNAGTTVVGASGNGVGGAGVVLTNTGGDLLFGDFDVFADGGAGLNATGTAAYTGSAGLRLTMPASGANVAATGGPSVTVNTVTGSLTFSSLASTNTASTGISLTAFADGGGTNSVFSAPSSSSITTTAGATGPIFNVSGGNAAVTYGGTITNSSGSARAVSVTTWAGDDAADDILFSGAIDENGAGILLNGNGGAAGRTITFSGGMDVDTTTGEGFAATSNTTPGGLHITGTNDITSTSATALRVTSTTIGSSDLNFRNISSGNATAAADPANGIVLNSTGTLGGLKITGTGASGQGGNGTGGLIQNTTSHGVSLTTTREAAFANLTIQNIAGSGINGTDVTDFTYDNGTITNVGTGGGVDTSNIAFGSVSGGVNNLDGVVVITDSILNTARYHGIDIYNESGTISNITVTGNSLTSATGVANSQGSGIRVNANGSAGGASVVTTGTFSNNAITNFPMGVGIQVQGGNAALGPPAGLGEPTSGVNMITITSNAIAGSGTTANVDALGSNAIQTAMTGTGNAKFFINSNGTVGTPIRNFLGIGVSCSGGNLAVIECTVSNNFIDASANIASSSGIAVGSQLGVGQAGSITSLIENNNVSGMEGNGILAGVTNSNNSGNFTIRGNTIGNPTGGVRPGIRVESGSASGDTTLCLDMNNNVSGASGGHAGLGIRKQGSVATTNDFGIVGLVPSPGTCGNAEDRVTSQNPGAVSLGSDCDGNPGSKTLAISGSNYVSCVVVLP